MAKLAVVIVAVSIAFPSGAAAATVVPPGNSAATQYTEAIPTAGGNAVSEGTSLGGRAKSPEQVLGHHATKALKEQGQAGQEVAEVAAETAPAAATTGGGEGIERSTGGPGQQAGSEGGSRSPSDRHAGGPHQSAGGGAGGNGPGGSGGNSSGQAENLAGAGGGSSGLGQVVGQATAGSSGHLGLLLPLILLGALAWAVLITWRRRGQEAR